jgi:hypothetical protein
LRVKEELKYEVQFKFYLTKIHNNPRVISDCISRCKRVQKFEGDLAEHFKNDNGQMLLYNLNYSMEDVNKSIQPKHSVPIQGNKGFKSIYEGTKTLESAVRHYFEFIKQL